MEHYPIKITNNFRKHFMIWCSDTSDHLYEINGYIPYFNNLKSLNAFSQKNTLKLKSETSHYNFDKIRIWCFNPNTNINCDEFLNAWNLFGDLAATYPIEHLKFEELTQKYIHQYNRLFYGCNILRNNTYHPNFNPKWSSTDLQNIKYILVYGLQLFNTKCRGYAV